MNAPVLDIDIRHWCEWIGREEVSEQCLDIESLRRYAAALGESLNVEQEMPALAHWAWFLPVAAARDLGEDGHRARGGFLPPVSLPRRMFAASSMRFSAPLQLEAHAQLTSTICDVRHRRGRSGDLVFVELERRIVQHGQTRVEERQSIVYRGIGDPVPAIVPQPQAMPIGAIWQPEPVDLFRFSAVTFNAHRIHYDHLYATTVEGYPALVVHGPFTAARLFAHARAQRGISPNQFTFRALAPLFVSQPVQLLAGEHGEYHARRCDGEIAMTAAACFD